MISSHTKKQGILCVLFIALLCLVLIPDVRAQYNEGAGKSDIATQPNFKDPVKRDAAGNLRGSSFDLARDGAFAGQRVVIVMSLDDANEPFSMQRLIKALKRKGFLVDVLGPSRASNRLKQALEGANQLWLISSDYPHLSDEEQAQIIAFFRQGHGLYLLGDNAPYFADVNPLAKALFQAELRGDRPGEQVVRLKKKGARSGILPDHMLSTGIEALYEGNTISEVTQRARPPMMTPFLWGAEGQVVAALYESQRQRAILDGGFTRLEDRFIGTAGTERYMVNAAAWLANVERFGDTVLAEEYRKPVKLGFTQAEVALGALVPGQTLQHDLFANGDLSRVSATFQVIGAERLPRCLVFTLAGKRPSEPLVMSSGDTLPLVVSAASYCGVRHSATHRPTLRILPRRADGQPAAAPLDIPLSLSLEAHVEVTLPKDLSLEVGGAAHLSSVVIQSNSLKAARFQARMAPASGVEAKLLAGESARLAQGKEELPITLLPQNQSALQRLIARADSCCVAGRRDVVLTLTPLQGSEEAIRVVLPMRATGGDVWGCWGERIMMGLLVFLAILVAAYIANMFRQSHFLRRELVASKLVPLRWDDWRAPVAQDNALAELKRLVRRDLSLWARVKNWLLSNPLKIGWPGNAYYETARLYLEPSRDVNNSRLALLPERDLLQKLRREPERALGQIMVTARGGLAFVAVPDRDSRLGRLEYRDIMGALCMREIDEEGHERFVMVTLKKDDLLDIASEREPDMAAGWRVG